MNRDLIAQLDSAIRFGSPVNADFLRKVKAALEAQPEASATVGAVFLIDGKPHRECDCDRQEGTCPRGVARALQTTQLSRCLIPATDALIVEAGSAA